MNQITVYTSNHCRYCVMLKNFLSDQNISYQEVNVETNPATMQQLVEKTGQLGVPQTEVNGQWVVGYDPNSIMSALKK
ncbi:YruB family glutaredoxin [Alkalihalobacillus alcalophilus ATCC 27647 = CGMCC 1.3604]|uniref:Glutaredoxin n=1 Tax=Alkalihalobacillus alcalophilus ATCC 27647 = CGMCC 1.3604 TaxID=1218173 RepID=A0A094WF33_ALKAL|nr:glutaredoxin family protein [Alkalihalobacillus alcalophilus]KGA96359.1 glutaredoxin [Alkalihalobacillus alcalophilus ATCC 27647 = CGMCC 1.3604]MED1563863.1 glutaredoxin family protein [Alkalihalobacillus alcalophilus]THG90192.1 YruB family glutaredoxin [Alkalihalobacillus alcalophilus ATCC 27647 = CGMCC 1.3604]